MATNADSIRNNYKDAVKEDRRFMRDRASGLEAYYTKKYISLYITAESSVLEIGCGTGYYGLFLADKCRNYLGIDITPEHIDLFTTKIKESGHSNISAHVGDATQLDGIADGVFDVVLVLGPMYHLPPEERELVFEESRRVSKDSGVILYAYINVLGVYAYACVVAPEQYPSAKTNECLFVRGLDDLRPDVFFETTPEAMEQAAVSHGLKINKNVGVDFAFANNIVNNMSDEQFEAWMVLNDRMADSESCTGLSNHALLICRK